MRSAVLALAAAAALLVAGCAGQQSSNNADDYSGEQKAVAQVVDDLAEAGMKGEASDICNTLFATEVADALNQGNRNCQDAVSDQLEDASSFELDVVSVEVTGDAATAVVRSEFDGTEEDRTLTFEKANGTWRIAGLDGGGE
ncbi:MAG TPA: hypothetical protein VNZ62_22805 [Capillimicrobium sp.]|nr:hypothetical protein [Capillimicrobium sp.]